MSYPKSSPIDQDQIAPLTSWIIGSVLAVVVAAVVWIVGYSVINGPMVRAEHEKRIGQEIALENETICGQLGIRGDSQNFATCAAELAQVRRRHELRVNGDGGFD